MKCVSDDRCLVAFILFILGMGTLLPWNFFITALGYFNGRLNITASSNVSISDQEDPYMFNNMCVLISQLPLLLFTLLNSFVYQHIPEKMRIAGSMVFILLLFILTATLVKVKMEQDTFFAITMTTIWFINMFGAVLQGSLFGLVVKFPPKYSSLFMSGQAMAGIFSAIAMLISIISETDNESAALGYFVTPCAATLLTLCSYLLLPRLKFSRIYLQAKTKQEFSREKGCNCPKEGWCHQFKWMWLWNRAKLETVTLVKVKLNDDPNCSGTENEACKKVFMEQTEDKSPVFAVFKKIWVMAFCVTCVFMVTLSVFPAVTVLVQPSALFTGKLNNIFTALCCFLVFNVMDWLGRMITSVCQWPSKESRFFPILVVARVIFIPALMMCNIPNGKLPALFTHEFAFIAVMSLFAMTNGYFCSLSISYASQLVRPEDAETSGALMTFFLALGLSLGAAFSFLFKN